ncbi:tRNA (adenosine(37)-N6)-dimethylallyltransferase MiaA [Mangrovicella endophytica]|uniref:tRNA (adenosine(37)-N6)-dimethylallyltransferase MiaA n=1 Tax=Mangrovicella endophytica TaxID=2066697 RepID=UPI000C9DD781|nr:tRNA (adenosine(37)-N6)-dimethylallyltransferase MiaA [Mangrovicella endophytica]
MNWKAILIAGPTASGKSALALALARRTGGVIVNADSMQVYAGLPILTAQPSAEEQAEAPHRLYGHVDPARPYSVGDWLREAVPVIQDLQAAGRVPIVCGGTGLYFKALLGGLDDMPAVPDAIRRQWRQRLADEGVAALHAVLATRDAEAASRIRPSDPQRVVRALELIETTGGRLADLQAGRSRPQIDPATTQKIVLTPDRALLRQRIADRFGLMVEAGALDEVRRLRARGDIDLATGAAAKAIGVTELARVLDGEIDQVAAAALAVTRTRQYAKRQETWFRHQFDTDWTRIVHAGAV